MKPVVVDEAIEQFRLHLKALTRILGPDHPDTLTTRNNLALWLGQPAAGQ